MGVEILNKNIKKSKKKTTEICFSEQKELIKTKTNKKLK